ncbi:hypothetical protein B0O99DRAFT_632376 [Bisporella sp. PMI_857]|nr:hypothetical protein B0O99DRAFT_632376 [Bisporella sp. PMI_857]
MAPWHGQLLLSLPGTFADRPVDSVLRLPDSHEYDSPNHEIVRSWAILFTTDSRSKKRVLDHDELIPGAGTAAEDFLHKDAINLHLGRYTALNTSYNFTYQKTQNAALQKDELPYSDFPLFETRLRQLRHYMDTQKPRGLRQLWRDNRDSLNYFTFWGVITFGVSSLLLALFSLAVGIAQTVASFKSLTLSS